MTIICVRNFFSQTGLRNCCVQKATSQLWFVTMIVVKISAFLELPLASTYLFGKVALYSQPRLSLSIRIFTMLKIKRYNGERLI